MSNQHAHWKDYFPYEIRPAQEKIVIPLFENIHTRSHFIYEAANGTGKTIAVLSALLPYAKERHKKIIYMARTHSQMDRVIEELREISKKSQVSGITLRGRGSMCLHELVNKYAKSSSAVNEMCMQLKVNKKCQYFKNMGSDARLLPVLNALSSSPSDSQRIFELSQSADICPAETARKLLSKVDVIACSYLYMFDPINRSSLLNQLKVDPQDLILVIDECHNLPDVGIKINSDELSTFSIPRAINESRRIKRSDLIPFFESLINFFNDLAKRHKVGLETKVDGANILEEIELDCDIELDEFFFEDLIEIGFEIRKNLIKQGKEPRSSIGRIGEFFLRWYNAIGEAAYIQSVETRTFVNNPKDRYAVLRITSLDASKLLLPVFEDVFASVHISGSIGDADAYKHTIGLDRVETQTSILPSPYLKSNISVYYTDRLSTLYNHRGPQTYKKMVDLIEAVVENTPANVGLFTPSYQILRELFKNGLNQFRLKPIYEVKEGLSSTENDELIQKFKGEAERGGALLCAVLGGRSSEGTDFPGDLMNAVIVVGIPYAPPNPRVNSQIEYLEAKFPSEGRKLGYIIPAVNKASQAAGRAVRSIDDKAFILLLDFRYGSPKVQEHLPSWLKESLEKINPEPRLLRSKIKRFFED